MSQGELVAHRGYPYHYPENCLAGVQAALAVGAQYIEVDVQLSRDGVPLLFHDRDLQRLCRQSGAVHEYDWPQLQAFTLHGNSDFPLKQSRAPLAALSDLAALINTAPTVRFFIELKRAALEQFGAKAMLDAVLPVLQPVRDQCCLISYDLAVLQQLRQRSPAAIGVVIDDWATREAPAITALQAEYLFCRLESLPAGERLSTAPSQLVVFETMDPEAIRQAFAQGVELVETFAIGEMRQQLGLETG